MRPVTLVTVSCLLVSAAALFELGHLPTTILGWLMLPTIGAALLLLEGAGELATRRVQRFLTPLGIFVVAVVVGAVVLTCSLA